MSSTWRTNMKQNPIIYDVLVVSPGGVGCSYFMKQLNKYGIKTNHGGDMDGLKHKPTPKQIINKTVRAKKCIFIWNDPLFAILSHFRRTWQYCQCKKLGNPYQFTSPLTKEKWIQKTMLAEKDTFGIERQWNEWYRLRNSLPIPIYFLDFRRMNDPLIKRELSKFIPLSYDNINKIQYSKRNSIKDDIPDSIVQIYERLDKHVMDCIQLERTQQQ